MPYWEDSTSARGKINGFGFFIVYENNHFVFYPYGADCPLASSSNIDECIEFLQAAIQFLNFCT